MTGGPQSQPTAEPVRQHTPVCDYVIRRNGGFYRPGAAGYTQSLGEAGRWTRAEADMYAVDCEGVTVHHVSEFPPDEIASLKARAEQAEQEVDVLESNARAQAKLLADTGRRVEELIAATESLSWYKDDPDRPADKMTGVRMTFGELRRINKARTAALPQPSTPAVSR